MAHGAVRTAALRRTAKFPSAKFVVVQPVVLHQSVASFAAEETAPPNVMTLSVLVRAAGSFVATFGAVMPYQVGVPALALDVTSAWSLHPLATEECAFTSTSMPP